MTSHEHDSILTAIANLGGEIGSLRNEIGTVKLSVEHIRGDVRVLCAEKPGREEITGMIRHCREGRETGHIEKRYALYMKLGTLALAVVALATLAIKSIMQVIP